MIEAIRPDLFRITIPLPGNPLGFLNSYVFKSADRHLVVDTGFDTEACRRAMLEGLKTIDVALDRTDYFITHFHPDHLCLAPRLAAPDSVIYLNGPDIDRVRRFRGWPSIKPYALFQGFPEERIERLISRDHTAGLHLAMADRLTALDDGALLSVGRYRLCCVQTPGHSFGHLCLYEARERLLLSGDHLLDKITPTIQCWEEGLNPLKWYLESLEKVYGLDVGLVLPGHRGPFSDHRKRIREIKAHHHDRGRQMMEILGGDRLSAYDIASRMQWRISGGGWEGCGTEQRLFAMGETISHLNHMESLGLLSHEDADGRRRYHVRQ